MFLWLRLVILTYFSSRGWESWDIAHRPLLPEGMPVLVDDDLLFEGGPGAPRTSVAVNQWLRELPASGAPSPNTWEYYAQAVKAWTEFLALHGVGLFDSRERLKLALGKYAVYRASGAAALAATTWAQHVSILSMFYRWAIDEGHADAEPFTYKTAVALFSGTRREMKVNLAVRRTPKPHVTIKYLEPDFADLFLDGLRGLGPATPTGAESWPATAPSASSRWPPGCTGRSSPTCSPGKSLRCRPSRRRCRSSSRYLAG